VIRKTLRILYVAAIPMLWGCATPYEHPASAASAKLKLSANISTSMCVDGKPLRLVADEAGYATIPVGQRLTLIGHFYRSDGRTTYSCSPRISFVPRQGESYFQDFEVEAERCTAFVYREVNTNPVGLDLVPTMARGAAC
jgi:hypothetical protein